MSMTPPDLVKARIEVYPPTDEGIKVLFNPNEYTINGGNAFAAQKNDITKDPLLQYSGGESNTLTLDLFFDTSEKRTNVREYTHQVIALMDVRESLKTPPVCRFVWGEMQFIGVIEKLTQKYTMFLGNGTPVRATLNVTFRACKGVIPPPPPPPPVEGKPKEQKQTQLKEGDTLFLVASREYQSSADWRLIATASRIDNPRQLKPGTTLTMPRLR